MGLELFKERGYQTHKIRNSKDIEAEMKKLIKENEKEFNELDVFQLVYSGMF